MNDDKIIPISEVLNKFRDWLLYERALSENTQKSYFQDLQGIINFLQLERHKNVASENISIHSKEIVLAENIRSYMLSRGEVSRITNKRLVSTLKTFFKFLRKLGIIEEKEQFTVQSPRFTKKLPRPFTKEEVVSVIGGGSDEKSENWCDLRDKAAFVLMYSCGFRISEVLSLEFSDFEQMSQSFYNNAHNGNDDLSKNVLKTSNNLYSKKGPSILHEDSPKTASIVIKGKGGHERSAIIIPLAFEFIKNYLKVCPFRLSHDTNLFLGKQGKKLRPEILQKKIRDFRAKIGLQPNITPHSFRHSFASHLLESGAELRHIQELLGHKSIKSTQVYTEINTSMLLETYSFHPMQGKKNNI